MQDFQQKYENFNIYLPSYDLTLWKSVFLNQHAEIQVSHGR